MNILLPVHVILPYNTPCVQGGSIVDTLYRDSPWSPVDTRQSVATYISIDTFIAKWHLFNGGSSYISPLIRIHILPKVLFLLYRCPLLTELAFMLLTTKVCDNSRRVSSLQLCFKRGRLVLDITCRVIIQDSVLRDDWPEATQLQTQKFAQNISKYYKIPSKSTVTHGHC